MKRVTEIWAELRSSLWFIPMVMFIGSLLLAFGFISLDVAIDTKWLRDSSPIFAISTDGARAMLLAVAGSMLTVVALSFTLTLNAMTHASGQFTPRILRNFMRDRSNQFVLGYFVGIFAYTLLASLSIRSDESVQFIPVVTAFGGLVFTLGGVIVLIYFIHHITTSLQITTIIDNIVEDTKISIDHMFPKHLGEPADQDQSIKAEEITTNREWSAIANISPGYIQNINTEGLMNFAEKHGIIIRMEQRMGHFVPVGAKLVSITRDTANETLPVQPDDEIVSALNALFTIGRHRMIEQDTGFGIRQIVDIALKALSPGVNDTSTAVNCVQYLGDVTGELARRPFPSNVRCRNGAIRVLAVSPTFEDHVEGAFDQIRISATGNIAIFQYIADAIEHIASCTDDKQRHSVLKKQLRLVEAFGDQTLQTSYEKEKLQSKLNKARTALS